MYLSVDLSPKTEIPQYGGTVGFAIGEQDDHHSAFCAACGWRGIPTFIEGKALTDCPYCTSRHDAASFGARGGIVSRGARHPAAKAKRKAARNARRRNR